MDGQKIGKLRDTLCEVFTAPDLEALVRIKLDKRLDTLVYMAKPFAEVVFELIERALREGWLGDLVLAACEARPKRTDLQSFQSEPEVLAAKLGNVESKLDDLKKMQLEMAFQLNHELVVMRYKAYGQLWLRTKSTKLYTTEAFGPKEVFELVDSLSDWYYSETGGILLTNNAKEFYFSLQDLVLAVCDFGKWMCYPRPTDPKEIFDKLLNAMELTDKESKDLELTGQELKDQVSKATTKPQLLDPKKWRKCCRMVSSKLKLLVDEAKTDAGSVIYAAIQQVASILRTYLSHELGSRLEVERPTTPGGSDGVRGRAE